MTSVELAAWERLSNERPVLDARAAALGWRAWQRAHAADDASEVVIARRGSEPVALAALTRRTGTLRRLRVRTLEPAGDDHWRCLYPITGRDVAAGMRALLARLASGRDWDELVLGPMLEGLELDTLVVEGAALGMRPLVTPTGRAYRTVFRGTWEAFYASRSANLRSIVSRGQRRLAELGPLALDEHRSADGDALAAFFAAEASGWKGAGGDAIASDPTRRAFYEELAREAASRGSFRLFVLRAGERVVAGDYCLEHEGDLFMLKTGYDDALAKCSPGQVLRARVLAALWAARDTHAFDFMPGGGDHADYKQRWANSSRAYAELRLFHPRTLRGQALARVVPLKRVVSRSLRAPG